MEIIRYGRQAEKLNGKKIIIYGGGAFGRRFYEEIYMYVASKDIYVCDRNPLVSEKFPNFVIWDTLYQFMELNPDSVIVIAIKSDQTADQVVQDMHSMNIDKSFIYRYVPESNAEWRQRMPVDGFFNGERIVYMKASDDARSLMVRKIKGNEAFLFSRWGTVEGDIVYKNKTGTLSEKEIAAGYNNAGIFPPEQSFINEYISITEDAAKEIDILCAGFWCPQLEQLFRLYSPQAELVGSEMFPPQGDKLSWTWALEGMKVLVIHPFTDLMRKQYDTNRKDLFNKLENTLPVLPEFELKTYQAVQSMGGSDLYSTWAEALRKMEEDISKIDFDIALIGCGAYGMPLGAYIKKYMNKKAVHIGGALQLLFGIKGKRWDNRGYEAHVYNEYWVRPTEDLKPRNYRNVEDGCYW